MRGTAVAIKKDITHENKYKNNHPGGSSGGLSRIGKGKRTVYFIYLPPTDHVTEEDMRELLEQLLAPMILLGDFNTHNPLWGSKKMSTRGRMMEKILDRYNLLCINKKEETYYRAFDGSKLTIDLTWESP